MCVFACAHVSVCMYCVYMVCMCVHMSVCVYCMVCAYDCDMYVCMYEEDMHLL